MHNNEHEHHRVIESNILSNNRVGNHNVVIIGIIPVVAVVFVGIVAVWPFLPTIGLMLLWLAVIAAICLALVITGGAIYACYRMRIHSQYLDRQSRLFTWSEGAAWIDDQGTIIDLSSRHEAAKLPPPRVTAYPSERSGGETEEKPEPEWYDIIIRRKQGDTLEKIAADTGWPYWKVQKLCKDWQKQVSGQQ